MDTAKKSFIQSKILNKPVLLLVSFLFVFVVGTIFYVDKAEAQTISYQPQTTNEYLAFLYGQLLQLQSRLESLQDSDTNRQPQSDLVNRRYDNPFYMQVLSMAPYSVGRNTVGFQGRVDIGSSEFGRVWFEYGRGEFLNKRSEKTKIESTRENVYKIKESGLKPHTRYSYRTVVEDEDGNLLKGLTRKFITVSEPSTQFFRGRPIVDSEGVERVGPSSAEVKIFVSMNNYTDGQAFIVYSDKRSKLNDVEDDYDTYQAIEASSWRNDEGLKKTLVGRRDLVERSTKTGYLSGLTRASRNYYRACVEYSDNRDDLNFICGETESFVTTN